MPVNRLAICIVTLMTILPVAAKDKTSAKVEADTIPIQINTWQYSAALGDTIPYSLDTALNGFQLFNPLYRLSPSWAYGGNIGLAARSNIFIHRPQSNANFLTSPYAPYMASAHDVTYFNTRRPYSEARYSYNPGKKTKDEQTLGFTFAQNVNPRWNVGFNLSLIMAEGHYQRQRTRTNATTLFTSYLGDRYQLHANVIINKIDAQQNGGLNNVEQLWADTVQNPLSKGFQVNLYQASTLIRERSLFVTHKYFLNEPKSTIRTSVQHTMHYQRVTRRYADNLTGNDNSLSQPVADLDYYGTQPLYNPDFTQDSSVSRYFTNQLRYNFAVKGTLRASAFIENRVDLFKAMVWDTLKNYTLQLKSIYTDNYSMGGSLYGNAFGRVLLEANLKTYFSGYHMGDSEASARGTLNFGNKNKPLSLIFGGSYRRETPGYFLNNYVSNHYYWRGLSLEPTLSVDLYAHLVREDWGLHAGAHNTTIDNYIYFTQYDSFPQQYSQPLNIVTFFARQRLRLGEIFLLPTVYYQLPTNDSIMGIPSLAIYASLLWDHTFNFRLTGGKLRLQFGADLFYTSEHYMAGYSPGAEMFWAHNQYPMQGAYPFSDVFLNVKIKRLRVSVKYENLSRWFNREGYQNIMGYPVNQPIIKVGLAWTFYD